MIVEYADGSTASADDHYFTEADLRADARARGVEIKTIRAHGSAPAVVTEEAPMPAATYAETATLVRTGMDAMKAQVGVVARAVLGLSDELKTKGWRQDAGVIRDGQGAALWPVAQTDPVLARAIMASQQSEYKGAWLHWLQQATRHPEATAYGMLAGWEQKALSEGTDTAGGYLVPAELAARIIAVIRERSTVRAGALVIPTGRDHLQLGQFDFTADWQGETDTAASETTITPVKRVDVNVMKARVKTKISNDLLADAPALEGYLADAGGAELALLEDQAFVGGNGVNKPLGFAADAAIATTDVEGTTSNAISNTSADAGSATKLMTLDGTLPDAFWRNARWFLRGSVHAKINALCGPGGTGWAFDPSEVNAAGEVLLLGHPVSRSQALAADGTDGARVVALCDLSRYVVATRGVVSMRVLREPFGDLDQSLFVLQDRVGGVLAVPEACRVGTV